MASVPRPVPNLDTVWRASELGGVACRTVPSGYRGLDEELPGAGWPRGHVTEVLQTQPGLHEWRLLATALRSCLMASDMTPDGASGLTGTAAGPSLSLSRNPRVAHARGKLRGSTPAQGVLVLIGSPHQPNLPALACQGIPSRSLLWVDVDKPSERLWAAEQALRCHDLAALLLWSPQVRPEQLRRLQVAAQVAGQNRQPPLVFVFRPSGAQHESSPAPLRVSLRLGREASLEVQLVKRRGPQHHSLVVIGACLPPALMGHQPFLPPEAIPVHVVDCPAPSIPVSSPSADSLLAA